MAILSKLPVMGLPMLPRLHRRTKFFQREHAAQMRLFQAGNDLKLGV